MQAGDVTDANCDAILRCTVHEQPKRDTKRTQGVSDRVAVGRCRPTAPTDPYVLALEHTVPRIMDSLRTCTLNGQCELEQAGSVGASDRICPKAACEDGCGV